MRKTRSILFLVALLFVLPLSGKQERKLVILHTNDLHSRLTGFAPESSYSPLVTGDDNTIGGFSRLFSLPVQDFIQALGAMTVMWLSMYFLYRKNFFLKI